MKVYDDYIMFIDYIVNAISNGNYLYYQVSYIPTNKLENENFLIQLDKKMANKYKTNINKNDRLQLRRKEKARFLGARYKHIVIVMKTKGNTDIAINEKWLDITKTKMEINLTEHTQYRIGMGAKKKKTNNKSLDSKVTVTLGPVTLNRIKLACINAIQYNKSIKLLMWEWNKINGFNGWSGINKQKQQLKQYLVNEVCKHFGLKKNQANKLFRINTFKAKCVKSLDLENVNHLENTKALSIRALE